MNKLVISITVILLVVAGAILIYLSIEKDDGMTDPRPVNINIEPLTNAGPSVLTCDTNDDCEEICDPANECLIPSCTKNPTKPEGTCVCLDTCSGN